MTNIVTTDPVNGTTADADLIAADLAAIKAVVNGDLDNGNIAAGAAIALSKLAVGGSGQVLGMLAGAPTWLGGLARIGDVTLGSNASSIDFSSIPATYGALFLSLYMRKDEATLGTPFSLRFNGDSGANYDFQMVQGSAATATAGEGLGQNQADCGVCPGSSAGANLFASVMLLIPHYTNSANNKDFVGINLHKSGTSSGSLTVRTVGGSWRSNNAINEITFFPGAASNFVTGSRATLYGIG